MAPWSDCLFSSFIIHFRVDRLRENLNKSEWIFRLIGKNDTVFNLKEPNPLMDMLVFVQLLHDYTI